MNETEVVPTTADECLLAAIVSSDDGEVLAGLWYVGVIMSIFSSIASNLGVNVQKLSMQKEMKKVQLDPNYVERPYVMQKIWLGGLLLVIGGSIGDFAALGFASQTLATPVGGFTMVANVFFANFFLNEILSKQDIVATVLVVLGVIAVAASADKTEKTYTLECLLKLYGRPVFLVYVAGVFVFVGVLYSVTRHFEKLRKDEPTGPKYRKYKKIHAICPAALSGVIGAQSVLFAKCSAELIKKTFAGENQFDSFGTYAILGCMLFTIFNQLHWLAVGLKNFDAVMVIPVFQCFFITGGVIGGGIMFDEFSNLKLWEQCLFTIGVSTTILGVYLLAQREHEHESKVSPEANADGVTIIGGAAQDDNTEKQSDDHTGSNDGFDRPPTPMPLSLQYHSLAMSDLYTALREGLTTPERNHGSRRNVHSAPSGQLHGGPRRADSTGKLPDVREDEPVNPDAAGEDTSSSQTKPDQPKARRKSANDVKQAW